MRGDVFDLVDRLWSGEATIADHRPVTQSSSLVEVGDGCAFVPSFANVSAFSTDAELVLVDTGSLFLARTVHGEIRRWNPQRLDTAVYSHGHIDHVFGVPGLAWPTLYRYPDTTYSSETSFEVGGELFELHHARGETDDHTWTWVPARRTLCCGDLFDSLVDQTLALMNEGCRLDEVLHTVAAPEHLRTKPYLQPVYDEPEFVVRNIWRLYGGWYDGNPANLKPAPESAFASEVARLAGGSAELAGRALELAGEGDLRLACHLAELAVLADPEDGYGQGCRADVYRRRVAVETSTMAKGIFGWATSESQRRVDGERV